ncbi:MAG: winged helix-turn-helix domain-containing protein [Shimia sp.]
MTPTLDNRTARHLFLQRHGLTVPPTGAGDVAAMVGALGFVQVDSINTVARAHDHILWARRRSYRPRDLAQPLGRDRTLFEDWTHDAAILPTAVFPHWRHRHARLRETLPAKFEAWGKGGFAAECDTMLRRIGDEGPLSAAQVGDGARQNAGGWWNWQPVKAAMEFLWRTGELAICHRRSFQKVYDLTERVVPPEHLNARTTWRESRDWAQAAALGHLGFGTASDLAAFWDLVPKAEGAGWEAEALGQGWVVPGAVVLADGTERRVLLPPDWERSVAGLTEPAGGVRILSPFDPALRDRKRIERLFGFEYRIEVFVPEAKRRYGYYVFPVLEGLDPIGRIDLRADRKAGVLHVQGFWPERGVRMGTGRIARLGAEIGRIARLAGVRDIALTPGPRTPPLPAFAF